MPYKIWNEKLRTRLQQWYKIYLDSCMDAEKVFVFASAGFAQPSLN